MKKIFTKQNLYSGDIIETRNGERGVVILEKDCIVYQAGGLDCMEVFTDDLFVDGPQREGDIFKVYHDPEGPLGFNKLFDLKPVFVRKNNKETQKRAEELSKKYDMDRGRVTVMVFEPCFRRCEEVKISALDDKEIKEIDLAMSEAPSMTVCGQIKIDRTFISVPGTENLFIVYNKYQEKWHLSVYDKNDFELYGKVEPIVIIPDKDIKIHSRCLLVRMNKHNQLEDLQKNDFEKVKTFLNQMQ